MAIETSSPEANYLTRNNIVHPESNLGTATATARVDALQALGLADIQARKAAEGGTAASVSGLTIKRGR